MSVHLDKRYPEAGFVMVDVGTNNERRMVYAPMHIVTHSQKSDSNEPIVLYTSSWGDLTDDQKLQCKKALEVEFPGRKIILTT